MDRIKIQNLEVFGHHGVFSEETKLGQKFLVKCHAIYKYACSRLFG